MRHKNLTLLKTTLFFLALVGLANSTNAQVKQGNIEAEKAVRRISPSSAKGAVQTMLDICSNRIPIKTVGGPRIEGPKLPSGVEIPKGTIAGIPRLIERKGELVYEVPVIKKGFLSRKRIGEMCVYVEQEMNSNEIKFQP